MTVGTVAYAASEQLMGEGIDGRADQYALGGHRVSAADRRHRRFSTPIRRWSSASI